MLVQGSEVWISVFAAVATVTILYFWLLGLVLGGCAGYTWASLRNTKRLTAGWAHINRVARVRRVEAADVLDAFGTDKYSRIKRDAPVAPTLRQVVDELAARSQEQP